MSSYEKNPISGIAVAPMTPIDQSDTSSVSSVKDNLWIRFMSNIGWYPSGMDSAEKLLVLKLDLSILVFGCLSFFTKYLDQQSLTNAYVSGMKEELKMFGNEFNYITITFWASYCTAMIPACYYLTHYPANIVLPALEFGWGISTLGLGFVNNVDAVYGLRFLVGLFECCSFTGTIYVIGSWYKPGEIGRRIAFFFISSPLGTMFAGYLQAAAYKNLNGVHGYSGWRWLFIIDAIITIGISIFGFIIFPDVPSRRKPILLSPAEQVLAQKRLAGFAAPAQLKLSRDIFRRVLGRWHFYAFVTLWTVLDQNILPGGAPFSLYLKAHSPQTYSVVQVNTLPTITTAISVVAAIFCGIAADRIGRFWPLALLVTCPVLVGMILLNVWGIGERGRLAAFMLTGFMGPLSPMSMGWATTIMQNDAEERAVVTASMNAIGQAIMAGTQVVQYPAKGAPRWIGGFKSSLATTVLQVFVILGILYLSNRDKKRAKIAQDRESGGAISEAGAAAVSGLDHK